MAMRRRRKKLTTTISNIDRRVRTVELKGTYGITSSTVAADPANDIVTPVISVKNDLAPNAWVRVTGGWYYPQQYIGQKQDRIEYYHEGDIDGLDSTGKTAIRVSGVYSGIIGARASTANQSPDTEHPDSPLNFAVLGHNYPTGDTRANYPWYEDVPAGMNFEVCSPNVDIPVVPQTVISSYLTSQPLIYRSLVVSVSATLTHGTIVFDDTDPNYSAHYFKVGDVVSVSDLDAPFSNGDGIAQVTSVAATSITFKFQTALTAIINSTPVTGTKYVYAVMQKYTRIGSTWVKPVSGAADIVYVWDGVRYISTAGDVTLPPGLLVDDGLTPEPPTIDAATLVKVEPLGVGKGYTASIKLNLIAPVYNMDAGTGLPSTTSLVDDLIGYTIRWRTTSTGDFTGQQEVGPDLELTLSGFDVGKTYYFGAYARDFKRTSTVSNIASVVVDSPSAGFDTPSAPIVGDSRLGVILVSWDGNNYLNAAIPESLLKYIEVHVSTSLTYTPSASTLAGYIYATGGSFALTNLAYSTQYYVSFVAVKIGTDLVTAVKSGQSTIVATGTIKPVVNTDLISKSLTTWPFSDGTVDVNALANGAVSASKLVDGAVTASKLLANAVTSAAIAANAVGTGKIAANAVTAGTIAAGAVIAGTISAGAIGATEIAANAITANQIAANAIGADEIAAGAIVAGKIAASAVVANSIAALAISAGHLGTNSIISGKIAAGSLDGKTITGAIIQTTGAYYLAGNNYNTFADMTAANPTPTIGVTAHRVANRYVYLYAETFNSDTGLPNSPRTGAWKIIAQQDRIMLDGSSLIATNTAGEVTVNITGATATIRTSVGSSAVTMDGNTNAISFSYSGANVGHIVSSSLYGGSVDIRSGATPTSTGVSHVHVGTNSVYAYVGGGSSAGLMDLDTSSASITGGGALVSMSLGSVNIQSANVGGIILGDPVQPTTAYVASGLIYNLTTSSAPNMWVATSTNGYKLYRSTNPSSRRFKREIRPLTFDHAAYTSIEPIIFKYNEGMFSNPEESTIDMLGFIAEDFEAAGLESLVTRDEDGELSGLRYDKMVMFLHSIVSEQSKKIAALEAKTASI